MEKPIIEIVGDCSKTKRQQLELLCCFCNLDGVRYVNRHEKAKRHILYLPPLSRQQIGTSQIVYSTLKIQFLKYISAGVWYPSDWCSRRLLYVWKQRVKDSSASANVRYSCRQISSYLTVRHNRSVNMLSKHLPLPSMLIRISRPFSIAVYSSAVNWLP